MRLSGVREEALLEAAAEAKKEPRAPPAGSAGKGGAAAMPRARSVSPAARGAAAAAEAARASSAKKRKDTGLQGSYWTSALSPRGAHTHADHTVSSAAKKR